MNSSFIFLIIFCFFPSQISRCLSQDAGLRGYIEIHGYALGKNYSSGHIVLKKEDTEEKIFSNIKWRRVCEIPPPANCERISVEKGSFSEWIRNLPLKETTEILDYRGKRINPFYKVYAVIDKPLLFKEDLEQCADFAMRFWHDYLRETNQIEKLWLPNYWGRKVYWLNWQRTHPNDSTISFLKSFMASSNSFSLKQGLKKIDIENEKLLPGDLIVQNETGDIGHVSIIFDICENADGERFYLVGFGFMPAQECHIIKADEDFGKEGWFTLDGYLKYTQMYLPFGRCEFRRFEE